MTTRAEVAAALALPLRSAGAVRLRDVDSLRAFIRHKLTSGEFAPGQIVDLCSFIEIAEEHGFGLTSDSGGDNEFAAAVLLEGLLLVSTRGNRATSMIWPGCTECSAAAWRAHVETRKAKLQETAARLQPAR